MAKKPTGLDNLTPWVPGQTGNPKGRPKDLLTRDKVKQVLGRFAQLTKDELLDLSESGSTPALEAMVASVMLKAIEHGDINRFEGLLQRASGKVKDELEVTAPPEIEELRKLSLEQLVIYIQETRITKAIE